MIAVKYLHLEEVGGGVGVVGRGCPHVRLTACSELQHEREGEGDWKQGREALAQFCSVMRLYSLSCSKNPWVLSCTHTSDAEEKKKKTQRKKEKKPQPPPRRSREIKSGEKSALQRAIQTC